MEYPTIDREKTAQRLKLLFRIKGVTPEEVREYLSLSCVQTIYRWLAGVNIPCIDHLYALSIWLKVPLDELIVGNGMKQHTDIWSRFTLRMLLYTERLQSIRPAS